MNSRTAWPTRSSVSPDSIVRMTSCQSLIARDYTLAARVRFVDILAAGMSDNDLILEALSRHRRRLEIVGPIFLLMAGAGIGLWWKGLGWPFAAIVVGFPLWK